MYVRSMLLTLNVLTVHQIQYAIYRIKVNEKKRRKKTPPHVDALSSFPLAISSVRLSAYGCYGTVTYVWHPPPLLFSFLSFAQRQEVGLSYLMGSQRPSDLEGSLGNYLICLLDIPALAVCNICHLLINTLEPAEDMYFHLSSSTQSSTLPHPSQTHKIANVYPAITPSYQDLPKQCIASFCIFPPSQLPQSLPRQLRSPPLDWSHLE